MRGCTRCGATYATNVLFCPKDGAGTVEIPAGGRAPAATAAPRPHVPAAPPPVSPPPQAVRAPAWNPPPQSPPPRTPPRAPQPPAPAAPPPDPFLGKMVGNFRLSRRLGAGGMGAVYEGVHPIVGIRVAVKLLGGNFALDRDLVDRFFSEARTLNQVAHENIVKVVDLGAHADGFYYCVMELLEGETLSNVIQRGRVELSRALGLVVQACDALAAAHEKGIVHRDLKPANIMLVRHPATGAEVVKLVDFGIAKLQSAQPQHQATVTGTVIGTPAYMSPEQAAGRVSDIDPRSDLYSLGLVAYELVTGHHPFEGRAVGELIVAQVTETPPPPGRLYNVPARVDDAVMRLLRKRKEERFPTAAAAAAEFRAIVEALRAPPEPPRAPTPAPVPALAPSPVVRAAPPPAAPPAIASPPPTPLSSAVSPPPRAPTLPSIPSAPARREATMAPGSGVRLATRRPPRGLSVRPLFLLALLAAGGALGAAVVGALDAEPVVASAAHALGLAPEPVAVKRSAPPSLDGTNAAFQAAPAIEACRRPFHELRQLSITPSPTELEPALVAKLDAYKKLGDCLDEARRAAPTAGWAGSYVHAVAAFEFALALDRLPPELLRAAESIADGSTKPFHVELFASQAASRFGESQPEAPEIHRAYIDKFQIELDAIRQRRRSQGVHAGVGASP